MEFRKSSISYIADNLHRSGGQVPDHNNVGETIPTPPFVFGAKSQKRLNVPCNLVHHYNMIGSTLTASNLNWSPTIANLKDL